MHNCIIMRTRMTCIRCIKVFINHQNHTICSFYTRLLCVLMCCLGVPRAHHLKPASFQPHSSSQQTTHLVLPKCVSRVTSFTQTVSTEKSSNLILIIGFNPGKTNMKKKIIIYQICMISYLLSWLELHRIYVV